VLAGFPDGRVDQGPGAGPASLVGLGIARERGWSAPAGDGHAIAAGDPAPSVPEEKSEKSQAAAEAGDSTTKAATVEEQAPTSETAAEKKEAK
jgi:NADH-quinone oxidoreductase subunit E